jgi:hypothetical protein
VNNKRIKIDAERSQEQRRDVFVVLRNGTQGHTLLLETDLVMAQPRSGQVVSARVLLKSLHELLTVYKRGVYKQQGKC